MLTNQTLLPPSGRNIEAAEFYEAPSPKQTRSENRRLGYKSGTAMSWLLVTVRGEDQGTAVTGAVGIGGRCRTSRPREFVRALRMTVTTRKGHITFREDQSRRGQDLRAHPPRS